MVREWSCSFNTNWCGIPVVTASWNHQEYQDRAQQPQVANDSLLPHKNGPLRVITWFGSMITSLDLNTFWSLSWSWWKLNLGKNCEGTRTSNIRLENCAPQQRACKLFAELDYIQFHKGWNPWPDLFPPPPEKIAPNSLEYCSESLMIEAYFNQPSAPFRSRSLSSLRTGVRVPHSR